MIKNLLPHATPRLVISVLLIVSMIWLLTNNCQAGPERADQAHTYVTELLHTATAGTATPAPNRNPAANLLTFFGRHRQTNFLLPTAALLPAVMAEFMKPAPAALTVSRYTMRHTARAQTLTIDISIDGSLVYRTTITAPAGTAPLLAIVIDDWGYSREHAPAALTLPGPVTHAILPNLAYTRELAELFGRSGAEIILHQPMEPKQRDSARWESHTLRVDMPAAEIRRILRANLTQVPGARGVNNHMGSKATNDPVFLRAVMTELRGHNLYFLDSLTADQSRVTEVAALLNIPCLKRDVFIDNVNEEQAISRQLQQAADIARRTGAAVAIGHARPLTLDTLNRELRRLQQQGIVLAPVSVVQAARAAAPRQKANAPAFGNQP